jgi:hypothetical protein
MESRRDLFEHICILDNLFTARFQYAFEPSVVGPCLLSLRKTPCRRDLLPMVMKILFLGIGLFVATLVVMVAYSVFLHVR